MVIRICFMLVVIAAATEGKANLHLAIDPVEDGNRYLIAVENNFATLTVKDELVELTSHNESLEFNIIWEKAYGLKLLFVEMNKAALNVILENEGVAYVEQDSWLTPQNDASSDQTDESGDTDQGQRTDQWGLDRIDQRILPLDNVFSLDPNAGTGASIYVVGTGIHVQHEEFGGRAINIYDYRGDDWNGRDCNGHGTHMASVAAGKKYGVAKNATIYGLRVARCRGIGKLSDMVKAMTWLSKLIAKKCVTLLGMGSPGQSPSLDNAIHTVYTAGCLVVLPAGNNNSNACDYSPSRMSLPITVAATTKVDYALYFSNQDKCVDLFAPGKSVVAAIYDGTKTAFAARGGTSTAAAFVTGAVAHHLAKGMPPFKIKAYLLRHATEDQIHQVTDNTPNKFLYVGKVSSAEDYKRVIKKKVQTEEKKTAEEKKEPSEEEKQKDKGSDSAPADKPKTEL